MKNKETLEEAAERLMPKTIISLQSKAIWRVAFETGRNYQLTCENNFNELLQSLQKKQFPTSIELTEDFKPLK